MKSGKIIERMKTTIRWSVYPSWLHALFKLSAGLLLLGFAFLGALLLQRWGFDSTIASTPILLVIALVALFWGTIPALGTLLVSTIALDYLILDPISTFHFPTWKVFLQLLPLLLSGLIIAILTSQREHARHLAERAQSDAERYADEVEQDALLREIVLFLTSTVLQEKVTILAQETAPSFPHQNSVFQLHPFSDTCEQASSNIIAEQIMLLERLIIELPALKTIHSSMIFFDQPPPYDLYALIQSLCEEQQRRNQREITVVSPSSPVVLEHDVEYVSVILMSVLQHAVSALPASQGLSLSLSQDTTNITLHLSSTRKTEQDTTSSHNQSVVRNPSDLWWLICQEGVKRLEGCLTFEAEELTWCVILPRTKRLQTGSE